MLVVDDDPIIRDMMVDILDFEGYSIRTARNGPEALEMLRGDEDYLVFLDLMMPGMSGKEVCTLLEAEPALRRRHVIILMSAMDRPDEDTALRVDGTIEVNLHGFSRELFLLHDAVRPASRHSSS